MKSFFITGLFVLSSSLSAATISEAQALFAKRGENENFAMKAANMYKSLSSGTRGIQLSSLKASESEALYYFAGEMPRRPKKAKLDVYLRALGAAKAGIAQLASAPGTAKRPEFKSDLAGLYYWYSANLGKWGETKGVLSSLGKWGELKKHTQFVIDLDKTVHDYGANRIFARALLKLPAGDKNKALAYSQEAYTKTLIDVDGLKLPKSTTTVRYYLANLQNRNKVTKFCEVYDNFLEFVDGGVDMWKTFDSNFKETKMPEIENDVKKFQGDKKLSEFYDSEC